MQSYEEFTEESQFEEVEGDFLPGKPDPDSMPSDPDQQLDYTQQIRMMAINQLGQNGQFPVHDKDMMQVLGKLLDGMDKQVFGKKRVVQEDQKGADLSRIAKVLAERSQFIAREGGIDPAGVLLADRPVRKANAFDIDLRDSFDDIDDKEIALERKEETSEEFFKRMEEENEELRKE